MVVRKDSRKEVTNSTNITEKHRKEIHSTTSILTQNPSRIFSPHRDKMVDKTLVDFDGHKVVLCEPLLKKLQCPLCEQLMCNPIQTERGELACEKCYKTALSESGRCPIDGEDMTAEQYYRDKFVYREINQLQCFCVNKSFGCSWKRNVGEIKDHITSCEYTPIKCSVCEEIVNRSKLNAHIKVCPKLSLDGKCIYAGCTFKGVNKEDLEAHLQNNVVAHAMLHTTTITNLREEFNEQLKDQKKTFTQRQETMETKMALLMEQISEFMSNAEETKIANEKRIQSLQKKIDELQTKPNQPFTHEGDIRTPKQLQDMTTNIETMSRRLSDLDLRQQLSENTSHSGKLIWKIDNITHRVQQAVTGTVTALHSAPTFTERHGYKFCGRLYLNGDGIGRGTHISLFFVLMRSEYDNLLSWPFKKRITMRLINQQNKGEDVVECFDTEPNSSSFKKPTKEMNIASGCPVLIPKEKFMEGGFVKDDTIFIELSVNEKL